jgi:hypothetical protein
VADLGCDVQETDLSRSSSTPCGMRWAERLNGAAHVHGAGALR